MTAHRKAGLTVGTLLAVGGLAAGIALVGPGVANADVNNPTRDELIAECRGQDGLKGATATCTFQQDQVTRRTKESVRVGTAAENCGGSAETLTKELGGETTFTESWSFSGSAGFEIPGFQVGGTGGYESGRSISTSEKISAEVGPGKHLVMTMGAQYQYTSGRMKVVVLQIHGDFIQEREFFVEDAQNKSPIPGTEFQSTSEADCGQPILQPGQVITEPI